MLFRSTITLVVLLTGSSPSVSSDIDEREELRHLIETGQYQEATDWVDEEAGVFPLLEARLFRETGKPDQALKSLLTHPRFKNDDPDLLASAAELERNRGNDDAAERHLKKALTVSSEHTQSDQQVFGTDVVLVKKYRLLSGELEASLCMRCVCGFR